MLDILVLFAALLVGVQLNHLIGIITLVKFAGADIIPHLGGMGGVFAHHKHKGFYRVSTLIFGICSKLCLCVAVDADAVN